MALRTLFPPVQRLTFVPCCNGETLLTCLGLQLAMWMGSRSVRWGLLISEQRFRILRREFVQDPSSRHYGQPLLYMSPTCLNDSNEAPLLPLMVYMMLTGNDDLPKLLPPPNIDHVTTTIFVDRGSGRQSAGMKRPLPSTDSGRSSRKSRLEAVAEHAGGGADLLVRQGFSRIRRLPALARHLLALSFFSCSRSCLPILAHASLT